MSSGVRQNSQKQYEIVGFARTPQAQMVPAKKEFWRILLRTTVIRRTNPAFGLLSKAIPIDFQLPHSGSKRVRVDA